MPYAQDKICYPCDEIEGEDYSPEYSDEKPGEVRSQPEMKEVADCIHDNRKRNEDESPWFWQRGD